MAGIPDNCPDKLELIRPQVAGFHQKHMTSIRDPRRYRREAARFRELAAAATDGTPLRDSYLGLSIKYERLAQILDHGAASMSESVEIMTNKKHNRSHG